MAVLPFRPRAENMYSRIRRGEWGTAQALEHLSRFPENSVQGKEKERDRAADLSAALYELHRLVGLKEVKQVVREVKAYIEIQQQRAARGLKSDHLVLHMIFRGNPGTGKTTVARLLGRLFRGMQVLPQGHLVEAERADLVGEYIGHTAQKAREKVRRAQGGILFVDEAYSLGRGGEKDFGKEAIDVLVKAMEDFRNEFVLVLAGYGGEMAQFLKLNPGLASRFPIQIDFPDYRTPELMEIAALMCADRHYRLTAGARERLQQYLLRQLLTDTLHFSNARLVRNLLEKSFRRQALRLSGRPSLTREELLDIEAEDLVMEEQS